MRLWIGKAASRLVCFYPQLICISCKSEESYSSNPHRIQSMKLRIRGIITVQSVRNIMENPSNRDLFLGPFLAEMKLDNSGGAAEPGSSGLPIKPGAWNRAGGIFAV